MTSTMRFVFRVHFVAFARSASKLGRVALTTETLFGSNARGLVTLPEAPVYWALRGLRRRD
jgi:hypothetical protein